MNAVVVGGGPNGLAAAVVLASAGLKVTLIEAADRVGGGARSFESGFPGLVQDHCSAFHPFLDSPFLRSAQLERFGLRWGRAEIECAHPLDDGTAGSLYRSVERTAAGLGVDARRWRALFAPSTRRFGQLRDELLSPVVHVPRHPLALARFGAPTLLPAQVLARLFATDAAAALFGGVALHGVVPLHRFLSSAAGLGILVAGQSAGWPVALGGSQAIVDALVALLAELGVKIETGQVVRSAAELPRAEATLFDLDPPQVAHILADRLPTRVARAYRRFRRGPSAFKVNFAVEDGIPWTAEAGRRAACLHLGGGFAEMAATERDVHAGRMPDRPFLLVGQQYLADPGRSVGNIHPVWVYAHVPHGFDGDATEAVTAQIERFAPGFRDRVVGRTVQAPADFARENRNFAGSDIFTGAKDPLQLVFGPRVGLNPYTTGVPGMFLCSAATPPGPGVHGRCGAHAAAAALRYLRTHD